ncbi:variant erythrocyte surface antigen-1 family protein [Babesia caballi]|uniref:Variant erythrocyte surface antigen-1 family protein n=1 Tax=Babesia caballi TaxID=5871 RepID=A0AAV4LN62_BABCB|nr:variant erythrocyte surface antigen-1 family protein [Babesia caballi]
MVITTLQGGIGRNQSSPYTSSYTAKATWNGQLDTPGSTEANTVASIFLGSMPMVYYFVTYLYWRCSNNKNGGWDTAELTNSHSGLNSFMINMDFPSEQLNGSMSGSQIVKLMTDFHYGFDGLNGVDKSGNSYEKFLGNLHKQHGESKINSAMDCPVYTLYRAAKAYLKYKFEEPKADENEENIRDIKKMFQNFTAACKSAYELKDEFAKFLTDINANITVSSETTNDNSSPSPAAPVAGTLSTLGLGGGAAAAYILDIGGAKTLINGLLRIG